MDLHIFGPFLLTPFKFPFMNCSPSISIQMGTLLRCPASQTAIKNEKLSFEWALKICLLLTCYCSHLTDGNAAEKISIKS
ncbi:MAG: hypothetical protein CME38_13745 [Haliea sp.]|nr:hypothetical protein [Haliea sp.]